MKIKGKKYNRLLVINDYMVTTKSGRKRHFCECQCDCGNIAVVSYDHLRNGHTRSCGCLHKEELQKRLSKHNQSRTRLFNIWMGMKYRCNNKNYKRYSDYGGRGIKVCTEWDKEFLLFKEWADANGYKENLTIDRIDVNGDYKPSNCRWITNAEQQRNKRNNSYFFVKGEKLNICEIERRYDINRHKIRKLLLEGKSIEEIILREE